GRAVAEDVDAVLAHRAHDRRRRYRAAERGGVEVTAPGGRVVERAALDRDDGLPRQRLLAVDQARGLRAVGERDRRDVLDAGLVGLREIGGVGVDLEALLGQPGDRAAG